MIVPPHLAAQPGTQNHRPRQQRPHAAREHQKPTPPEGSKRKKKGGRRDNDYPTTPSKPTPTPRSANTKAHTTHANTTANTPNPHHPPNEQTRPQQAPLPPPRKHKSAHATARGQARRVSAGTRGSRATDQNEAQTTRRGHADSAHKKRANNVVCAVCACARKGRTVREKVGHA